MSIYLFRELDCLSTYVDSRFWNWNAIDLSVADLGEKQSQVGSLTGAVHGLKDNSCVLREAQW